MADGTKLRDKRAKSRDDSGTTARGEETRARILAAALARFRRRGFDKTTMREIATAAKVALGAAYYYFPSKDAIVMEYYRDTQRRSTELTARAFAESTDVRERIASVIHTRLDVLSGDRRLLSAIFRGVADPDAPTSVFSPETEPIRAESMRELEDALAAWEGFTELDPDTRRVLVLALWGLEMGVILYFVHDTSPDQKKTRDLVDGAVDLVAAILPTAPLLAPILGDQVASILRSAGLLPEAPRRS
ncbi:MAG: TetR family transcriptional regulator [Polyangiaceae bacterium]|nr:TetR family transcriptional regulator [Polyangiaceae bacterium]